MVARTKGFCCCFSMLRTTRSLGMLNWFAVHGTSMNNTNKLVTNCNRGLCLHALGARSDKDALSGTGPFVATVCAANLGDVSTNTAGPRC